MLARTDDCNLSTEFDPMWSSIRGIKLVEPKSVRAWENVQMEVQSRSGIHGRHWYAVHCFGSPDEKVEYALKKIGWDVYVPMCRELRTVPKRHLTASQRSSPFAIKRPVEVPLFPRYPFVYFDLCDDRRHEVFQLMGVQGLICDGTTTIPQPAYIEDKVIAALKIRTESGDLLAGTSLKQLAYDVGELVRINSGAFAGHSATVHELPDVPIEKLDETARLSLLVSLFGRATVVEISLADIEKL